MKRAFFIVLAFMMTMFLCQTSFGAEQIEKTVEYSFENDSSISKIFSMVGNTNGEVNIENNSLRLRTYAGKTANFKVDISDWEGAVRKKGVLTYSFDFKADAKDISTIIMVGDISTKTGHMLAALQKTRLMGYDGAQSQNINEWLSFNETDSSQRVVLQFDFAQNIYTCSLGGKTVSHSFDYFADKTSDDKTYNFAAADKFVIYLRTYCANEYSYYIDNFKAEYTERYVKENVDRCVNFIKTINNNSTIAEFKNALMDVSNLVNSYGDYNTKIVADDNDKAITEIKKILNENGPYDESADKIDVVIPEIMEIIKKEMPMISINKASTSAEIKYSLSSYSDKYEVDISFADEYTDDEKTIFYNAVLDYKEKNGAFISKEGIATAISEAIFTVDSYAAYEKYKAANALTLPSVFEEYKDLLEIDMSYIETKNRNQTLFILKTMTINSYLEIPDALKIAYDKAKGNEETFTEAYEYETDYNRGPMTEKETTVLPNEKYFVDMTNHVWAEEAVEYLYDKNIVNGKSERNFAPYDSITREEFVKLIVTAFDIPMTDKNSGLKDVDESKWYAPYINAAYSIGIVQGNDNGYFGVGEHISREDVSVILYRTANVKDIPLIVKSGENFVDINEISEYARKPISILRYNGIINGVGEDIFGPKLNTSRAEAAVLIYKLLGV